jgi:hypothetical protein
MSQPIETSVAVQDMAPARARDLFDYKAPAELFPSRIRKGRTLLRYRRFDTAAEAIRFAVEDIPSASLLGAYLQVDDTRLGIAEIHEVYERADFPLPRSAAKSATAKD